MSVGVNSTADANAVSADFIKFTSGAASYAAAAGGSVNITVNAAHGANELLAASWFDSTNNQAVIGYFTAVGAALDTGDTFTEVARIAMNATDYSHFDGDNVAFY